MAYTFLLSFIFLFFFGCAGGWEGGRAGGSWSNEVLVFKNKQTNKQQQEKKQCEFICMFAMCLRCAFKLN